jgi:peptidoglycan/xylan/chitin deacetylase (PgdA/CDA1 family)
MLRTLIGVGAAAAVGAAVYQAVAPRAQWYGRNFVSLPAGSKQVALTYDDGPNDPHTLRLLEVLARHSARSTFFLIGQFVNQRPDIVREIVKAGHAIGNHTFTHPHLPFLSDAETRSQFERCQQAIADAVGQSPRIFRPPFGMRRPGTFQIARSLGLEPIMWSITGFDWNAPVARKISSRVLRFSRGGDVILLHDGSHLGMGGDRSQSVIATDTILASEKARGYQFVTIPEMLNANV